jgi:hypothetical protein
MLWGYGYKLSLYHSHPAPALRTIVAKLWIEPQNASVVVVQKLKDQSNLVASPHNLCTSIQYPCLDRASGFLFLAKGRSLQSFSFPISLRSPPHTFRSA